MELLDKVCLKISFCDCEEDAADAESYGSVTDLLERYHFIRVPLWFTEKVLLWGANPRKDRWVAEGETGKSGRKRLYILRICIFLAYLAIYGETEGLYRQYKELPPTPLPPTTPRGRTPNKRSPGPVHTHHSDSSSALLSDHFPPSIRILLIVYMPGMPVPPLWLILSDERNYQLKSDTGKV